MLCGANTSYNLQSYNIIDHIMDSLSLYLYSHGFSQCWLHKDFHIYFPFCWNSGIHIKYVKQKIVQPSLCRGLRGALWAPLSPLHNDIWVLTIVKTFIIILINEGAQRPPIPPQGLEWDRGPRANFTKSCSHNFRFYNLQKMQPKSYVIK